MQLINTLAFLLSASVASQTLAAPLDARCAYEPDHVHVTCKGNNENYARGVDVTYDLGKRFDAEQFMRRSDALDVIARGMDEQRIDAIKRADGTLDVDATGDMSKLFIRHGGEHHPLSHFLQGFAGPAKPHIARDLPTSSVDTTSVSNGNHDVDFTATVQLGNECYVHHNNKTAKCAVPNPKRAIVEPRDTYYGNNGGGGNNQGNSCNFGSGNIYTRDGGASFTCTEGKRAWVGKRDTVYGDNAGGGNNQGNVCNFGNGNIQARDGGATVNCKQTGHPTYGPNAGTTVVQGKRQNNQCIHGNKGDDGNDDMSNCEQTTSPIYGPNGGHAIIIARDFDLKNVDDVNAYHNEIRAFLPNANRNWRRDQEVCDGVPVGPVGPQADYYTKRDIPAAAKTPLPVDQAGLTYSAYVKRELPERRPIGNAPWADGGIIQPTPIIKGPIAKTSKAKRCVNTPIAPVGPSVNYHSKSELNQ